MFEKLQDRWIKNKKERVRNSEKRRKSVNGLIPVFKKYNISLVYLFGSVAKNSCGSYSDIDLYVEQADGKLYWKILRDLQAASSYAIDLYTQADDIQFIRKIKQRGIKIYES
ncbi:MAG: nucleotidyltransferase family protein [bacterium]